MLIAIWNALNHLSLQWNVRVYIDGWWCDGFARQSGLFCKTFWFKLNHSCKQTNSTHRTERLNCVVCLVFFLVLKSLVFVVRPTTIQCTRFAGIQYIARQRIGQFIRAEREKNEYQTMFSSKCLIQFGIWWLPTTWHLVKSNCNWKIQLEIIIFFSSSSIYNYNSPMFECLKLCYGFQCRLQFAAFNNSAF